MILLGIRENEDLGIKDELVTLAYTQPDKIEHLNNNFRLYLKNIGKQKHSYLLIGVQSLEDGDWFSFAYYIPEEFIIPGISLFDILNIFIKNFGLTLKMKELTTTFLVNQKVLMHKPLENPLEIIEILGNPNIPCELTLSHRDNFIGSLNYEEIHYCFAINHNRYRTWLNNVATSSLEVPIEWSHLINGIIDYLNPFKKVTLKILKSTNGQELNTNLSGRKIEIVFPTEYEQQILNLNHQLENLPNYSSLVVIPKFEKETCVFCDSTNISSEHIFPKWTRKYFKERTIDAVLTIISPGQSTISENLEMVKTHPISTYGYTSTNVCQACNEGWMSKLEISVKEIFTNNDHFKSNISALELNSYKSKSLAQWMMLKTILIFTRDGLSHTFLKEDIQNLQNGIIPTGFTFEIIEESTFDLDFCSKKGTLFHKIPPGGYNKEIFSEASKDFYVSVIQFGNFFLRTTYFRPKNTYLKLETFIVKSLVIYPSGFSFPHNSLDNEVIKLDEHPNVLKLRFLADGFFLSVKRD